LLKEEVAPHVARAAVPQDCTIAAGIGQCSPKKIDRMTMLFAAVRLSAFGTKRTCPDVCPFVRFEG